MNAPPDVGKEVGNVVKLKPTKLAAPRGITVTVIFAVSLAPNESVATAITL
jgi:hypothetical protein